MRGIKLLVIGTVLALTQSAFSQSALSIGLNFQYNKGGYPYGYYPIGYGTNFGQINQCMQSPYMMSAANAYSYGPNYGYNNMMPRPMPLPVVMPHLPPPMPYASMANANMGFRAPCGACSMPPPPPCSACGCGMQGFPVQGAYANAGVLGGASGIYSAGAGVIVMNENGIREWEKNDTAAIVAATGMTLDGLATNVYPYAPYRYAPTVNPSWYQTGLREYDLTPRPVAH